MIPAILSCLFVMYLYHSLNAEKAPATVSAPDSGSAAVGLDPSLQPLSDRLSKLQQRLDRLISSSPGGGKQ